MSSVEEDMIPIKVKAEEKRTHAPEKNKIEYRQQLGSDTEGYEEEVRRDRKMEEVATCCYQKFKRKDNWSEKQKDKLKNNVVRKLENLVMFSS